MKFRVFLLLSSLAGIGYATEKPNVVLLFADDISAREFPVYGSPGKGRCLCEDRMVIRDRQSVTDFKHAYRKVNGKRVLVNVDTGEPVETYQQNGWYWYPHVRLMNNPAAPGEFIWWPDTPEAQKNFSINTYGPDVELEFAFEFMERLAGHPVKLFGCVADPG